MRLLWMLHAEQACEVGQLSLRVVSKMRHLWIANLTYSRSAAWNFVSSLSGQRGDQAWSKGKREKIKEWVPGSHLKVEGHCICIWTEPGEEWETSHGLVTVSPGDTSRQVVPLGLFPLWCQLQCQHWCPTVASSTSSQVECCPAQYPQLGRDQCWAFTGTKQIMEISYSARENLEETHPLALPS